MRAPLAVAAALALALLAAAAPAAAALPQPQNLAVYRAESWHPESDFTLTMTIADYTGLYATGYRIRDSEGDQVREGRIRGAWTQFSVPVPEYPDTYSAEVWFLDREGNAGPAATARPLRFDNRRPSPVEPEPLPRWIGRNAFPLRVPIGHPAEIPLSGIRGYAVTVGDRSDASPCAASDVCTVAETTLPGGLGDDVFEIPSLPEGTSYLSALAVSGSGMRSLTVGREALHVDLTDPVTSLAGVPGGWADGPVRLLATAADGGSGMGEGGPWTPFTALRIDGGAPIVAPGDRVEAAVIPEGAHLVSYYARDAAGNVDDGAAVNGVQSRQPRTAWVRIDRTPPQAAFSNSQEPADPDLIRVRVSDPLSGADTTRGRIGVRPRGSSGGFQTLPAEPAPSGELRARWSSDGLPLGEYEFEAVAYDAAGNSTRTTRRADGSAMVLANPLKTTTALRGSFQGGGLTRLVSYGREVRLRGRLIAGLRSPLAGEPVRVVERFADGTRPAARSSTVKTDGAGAFEVSLPPGPSRTIDLAYAGSATQARASSPTLELRVRGRVALRASARSARVGGAPVVFRGRVLASPGTIPRTGLPVQLQFRVGRLPWAEFRTVQTDAGGRFRYPYRFSDDDSRGVNFRFRAYVPAREGWPFETAASRPVVVRGR